MENLDLIPAPASETPRAVACAHCGKLGPSRFCCSGCEAVYELLRERGLDEFYRLRSKLSIKPRSVEVSADSYAYLDDPSLLSLYTSRRTDGVREVHFFLEGVQCAACVWLTEKLGAFVPGVRSVRLDLGSAVLRVEMEKGGSFSAVARELDRWGYRPHIVRTEELGELEKRTDRRLLARTGVAGACAGNIMLLTTSLYAGATDAYASAFRWTSFGLALPVLLYSAVPFYRGAWGAIRGRQVSIDVPIALGITLGALSSAYNLLTRSPYLYFDSLSMLVFLMLASRYLLRKTQRTALNSAKLIHFLMPASARVWNAMDRAFVDVPVDRIQPEDHVEVSPQTCIPVDGVVLLGTSGIDCSLMTGESLPTEVTTGFRVFAGTVNGEGRLVIRATAAGASTRLAGILENARSAAEEKAPIVAFADRIARGFVAAVLIGVGIVFAVGLRTSLHEAINLALALSIVTCPCAFALATPLALSLSMGRLARAGILIKGADVLERLSQVEAVLLDKTGTLTEGKFEVLNWEGSDRADDWAAIAALEKGSSHPIGQAIFRSFRGRVRDWPTLPEVQDFREPLGRGVSGEVLGSRYSIIPAPTSRPTQGTGVAVIKNHVVIGTIHLGDRLRADSRSSVDRLRALGLRVSVLSGDAAPAVHEIAQQLGIPEPGWFAGLSPEQKQEWARSHPRALMVGDGANDAAALSAAYVGLAVHGGMEVSLRSADAYARRPGIASVPAILTVARETMRVIRRNLAFSLVYNAVGIAGVVAGVVTPLFAAVLMPLSALTVFLSSIAGTRRLRRALREVSE